MRRNRPAPISRTSEMATWTTSSDLPAACANRSRCGWFPSAPRRHPVRSGPQRWSDAEQDARRERDAGGEQQDPPVERRLAGPARQQCSPSTRRASPTAPPSERSSTLSVSNWRTRRHASRPAKAAPRSPSPRGGPRQQQVGDIGAHDQQDQPDDDAENGHRRDFGRPDRRRGRACGRARLTAGKPASRFWKSTDALLSFRHRREHRGQPVARRLLKHTAEIAFHLRHRHARLQAADDLQNQ